MRLVPLSQAIGCRLGMAVHDEAGRVLLAAGVVLRPTLLDALAARGYGAVYVEDPVAPDITLTEAVREETRVQAEKAVRRIFAAARDGSPHRAVEGVVKAVEAILTDLRAADTIVTLATLRSASHYTFVHSVNVCVLSLMVGLGSGLGHGELQQLGVGALLHDVGKVFCTDLVDKPGPLTDAEWERMRRHPQDGYDILRKCPSVHLFSAHVALQHHERLDGSGYPRGLRGEEILPFARIAAVADVYDAMTADRPFRAAVPPHEAMGVVLAAAGTKLDAWYVRRLASRLAVYPQGTIVRLSSGELAVVVRQGNRSDLPVVRVVADPALQPVQPQEHDLGADPRGRTVASVLPEWPTPFLERWRRAGGAGDGRRTPSRRHGPPAGGQT